MANDPKFKEGDIVVKTSGAKFWGEICNKPFKTPLNDIWHYDVCALHPDFFGTCHILVESQMVKVDGVQCVTSTSFIYRDPNV